MSEHTTTIGPWRIGDAGTTVFGPPNGNPAPEIVAQSCKKNARLIAAAPELLEALKFLVSAALTEPGMSIYTAHIRQAQIIIQKAGGATHE